MKTNYHLHIYTKNEILGPYEETKDICQTIADLSLNSGEYSVTEHVLTITQIDFAQTFKSWKNSKKVKDVEGEVVHEKAIVIIKGEVKDDSKTIKRKR